MVAGSLPTRWFINADDEFKKNGDIYKEDDFNRTDLGNTLYFLLNNRRFRLEMLVSSKGTTFESAASYIYLTEFTGTAAEPAKPTIASPVVQRPQGNVELEVLRYLCQPSSNGYARVFGTVKNIGTRTLKFTQLTVEFFSGAALIGQESGYITANDFAPAKESAFERIAKVDNYTRCALSFEDDKGKLTVKLP